MTTPSPEHQPEQTGQAPAPQRGPVDPRTAVYRPGDLWLGVGKPTTGFGAVKVRLMPLIWATGTLRSDVQQVPLAQIFDVDAMQSLVQKSGA